MHTIVKRAMRNKLTLLWGLAACAGRPALPSSGYTSFISRSDALSQADLNTTARGIVAGYREMRGGDGWE